MSFQTLQLDLECWPDDAERLGIGKSTLHYLREKASGRSTGSFMVYSKVRKKLMPKIPDFTLNRPRQAVSGQRKQRKAKLN